MTFETSHESEESSQPIYLYEIIVGNTTYRYNSSARVHNVDSFDYEPHAGIKHTEVHNSGEDAKNACTLTLDYDEPIAAWLRQYVPTQTIILIIKNYEIGQAPTYFEFQGAYTKYVAMYPDVKLTFSPLDYTMAQGALQKSYALNCQHSQYDSFCGLLPANFDLDLTITTYTQATDTVSVAPSTLDDVSADHFVGGYIEIAGVYGNERAWIVSQTSTSVVVDRRMQSLADGAAIKFVPSCKGSFDKCKDPALYNNKLKFLGAPHADKVNPFDETGVKAEV